MMIEAVENALRDRLEPEGYDPIVEAMLVALSVQDAEGRDGYETIRTLLPLMSLGFLVDWPPAPLAGARLRRNPFLRPNSPI